MELSGDVSTQVIRQGTFDTDPTSTLRSKSGGVTRGAVELPIITDKYPTRTPIIRKDTYDDLQLSKLTEINSGKSKVKQSKVDIKESNEKQHLPLPYGKKSLQYESRSATKDDAKQPKHGSKKPITEEDHQSKDVTSKFEKGATGNSNKLVKNDDQSSKVIRDNAKFNDDNKQSNPKDKQQFSKIKESEVTIKDNNKSQIVNNPSAIQSKTAKNSYNSGKTNQEEPLVIGHPSATQDTVEKDSVTKSNKRRFTKSRDDTRENKLRLGPKIKNTENITSDVTAIQLDPISKRNEADILDQQISSQPPPSTSYPGRQTYAMEPFRKKQPEPERMAESYESVYMERQTLLTAEVAYNKRIKQLEDELNQFLKTIEELRAENKSLRNRIDELEDGVIKVSGEQSANTVVINTETDELLLKMKLLKQENEKLTATVKETDDKMKVHMKKNAELEKENEEIKTKLMSLETKSKEMKKTIADKDAELSTEKAQNKTEELQKQLRETKSQLKQAKSTEDTLSLEITALKSMEVNMKKETETLKVENKKLQMEIDKYKEAAKEDEDEPKDGEVTAREKMELKSQIVSLQTENQKINEENIKLKAENLNQVKTIHDLEKDSKSYQSSVTAVESEKLSEIQTIQNENVKLKNEISTLKESHKDVDTKIKTLETENKTMSASLAQKKSELDELMKALSGENLEDELQTIKAEKEKLLSQLKENEIKVEDSSKLLAEVKIQRDQLESEKTKIEKELATTSNSNETLKSEIEKLKSEQKKVTEGENSKAETLVSKEKELEQANNARAKFQKEIENIKQEKKKEQEQLKKKIQDLEFEKQTEVLRLRDQLDSQKAQTEALKASVIDRNEVEELRQELRTIYNKYSEMTIELEQKERLETRNFEMTMRVDKMNAKLKLMENERRDWIIDREKMNDIEASNKRLLEENIRLKKLLGDKTDINGNRSGNMTNRIDHLERLQKDAVTRVRQLEGWVGGMYNGDADKPARVIVNMSPKRSNKKPYSRLDKKDRSRQVKEKDTVQINLEEPKRARSLDDVNTLKGDEESLTDVSTPPLSLPPIYPHDSSRRGFYGPGYSQIYKRKQMLASKRKV